MSKQPTTKQKKTVSLINTSTRLRESVYTTALVVVVALVPLNIYIHTYKLSVVKKGEERECCRVFLSQELRKADLVKYKVERADVTLSWGLLQAL